MMRGGGEGAALAGTTDAFEFLGAQNGQPTVEAARRRPSARNDNHPSDDGGFTWRDRTNERANARTPEIALLDALQEQHTTLGT